ncbi:hypothetical protein MNEG_3891 [Monoraphidium neglectum]|uniref:CBS domain-containing protein n=1 Tax=Monoraphidium neglectum TaxID=145388 RepID=A0A0D2NG94_9CHLO|nr:hypothetical protein MNEG_3891 [Monoraphidium neglectum]KIZ04066.1 hypothetical protein MNEG_3891 [Monoraphidium neglectum]|eukprot:XP_013903085.1 hypothetical protein MNEG_3891 [Monoraphidium neglectum]
MVAISVLSPSPRVEKLDSTTPDDLLAFGKAFCAQASRTVDKLQHAGDLWLLSADDASTLMDAVMESFRIQDQNVHHRLYVCSAAQPARMIRSPSQKTTVVNVTPGSARLDATGLKVTHVVSQSDVVKLLYDSRACLGGALSSTVEELELDVGAALTVQASTPALVAFGFMARDHTSSLGLVEDGRLVGSLSASDLRGLAAEDFPLLLLPAAVFAAKRALGPAVAVSLISTLEEVLAALVGHAIHRVYVTNAKGAPVSIITLTDVLRLVTKA